MTSLTKQAFSQVLNFDSEKISCIRLRGKDIIRKKGTQIEFENLILASEFMRGRYSSLKSGVRIRIAEIVGREDDIIYLNFCKGINIENGLKNGNRVQRKFLLQLISDLLVFSRDCGFLWGDFAPRNMVYDPDTNSLHIFDFERKLMIADCSQDWITFSDFARSYLYEELSCFIDHGDKQNIFGQVIFDRLDEMIDINSCSSKRKKMLLESWFGLKCFYHSSEIQFIEDMMANIATPIDLCGYFFFPMEYWEELKKRGGYYAYAKLVYGFSKLNTKSQRLSFLQKSLRQLQTYEAKSRRS